MDAAQITLAAGAVSAVVGAGYAVTRAVRSMARAVGSRWRLVEDFLGDWSGRPARPGHDREPGVMERLVTIERDGAEVRRQLGDHLAAHGQPANGPAPRAATRPGVP